MDSYFAFGCRFGYWILVAELYLIASFLFSRQGVVAPAAGNLEFLTGLIVSQ